MKKALALLSILFFISSCSSLNIQNRKKLSSNNPDQVNLDLDGSSIEVVPQEETIRIGERGGDVYFSQTQDANNLHNQNKKLKIGLNLGPGINRVINYVSVLKILERQGITPNIITGTELGAVVAAMYALGMTPEVIEWNFYKYFKEKKKNKPFESDWINEIDEMLLVKFKAMNIQDAKIKLFITLLDHNTNKTYYFDKGNIRNLLLLNLRLSNTAKESKNGQKYSAAFEKEVFNAKLLTRLGAEFTIAVDVLGSAFDFDVTNEFLLGVFGRASGHIQKEKTSFDLTLNPPLKLMNIDSTKDSSLYMQKTFVYMQKQVPEILKKIHAKQDHLLNSGNEQ